MIDRLPNVDNTLVAGFIDGTPASNARLAELKAQLEGVGFRNHPARGDVWAVIQTTAKGLLRNWPVAGKPDKKRVLHAWNLLRAAAKHDELIDQWLGKVAEAVGLTYYPAFEPA